MKKFILDLEMAIVGVLVDVEEAGYQVDTGFFEKLKPQLSTQRENVVTEIRKTAGPDFNVNSTPQIQHLLFDTLKLKSSKQTKTNKPSVDEETLLRLAKEHPVIPLISRARGLTKTISTYCSIPEDVGSDGRLHVDFNQLADTGRITAKGVIQQLPKNDEFGIRNGFIAAPGCTVVGADFCQQELFVLAQVSGDANMISAIETRTDLHGLAAVKVFNLKCEPNEVEKLHPDKRSNVKAIQFGLIYGSTAYGLALKIGCTLEEAKRLIEDYFEQFPAVAQMIKRIHGNVTRDGYVDDVFGRRRHLPNATLGIPKKKWAFMNEAEKQMWRDVQAAKRQAQNFCIQGAAATVTKLAMLQCHRHLQQHRPKIKMILPIHDELHFEVPDEEVDAFAAELPALMCDLKIERFGFKIPFRVDVKAGRTWGTMKKTSAAEERA